MRKKLESGCCVAWCPAEVWLVTTEMLAFDQVQVELHHMSRERQRSLRVGMAVSRAMMREVNNAGDWLEHVMNELVHELEQRHLSDESLFRDAAESLAIATSSAWPTPPSSMPV